MMARGPIPSWDDFSNSNVRPKIVVFPDVLDRSNLTDVVFNFSTSGSRGFPLDTVVDANHVTHEAGR
jgi:hypothetical protein